ncbi:MAG: N-acetylgalactosamine 6-sulfate sulfatase, partial [Verrucomicrobiota bacterium]
EAHDPPLKGQDEDRYERMESYVKDFRPLDMGSIQLEAGAQQLKLKVDKVIGDQAIDFRLLTLRRL